jgi:hypothetical protein
MPQVQPAKPDVQSRTNPIEVPEEQVPAASPAFILLGATPDPDLLNLQTQVRDGREVRHPDRVFVLAPPNAVTLATLRLTRRERGKSDDVTQRPLKLTESEALLPPDWFQEGDIVMVERR